MLKPETGPPRHWITYTIAALCFLLGGGIASSPGCAESDFYISESQYIKRDWITPAPPYWHQEKNAILIRYLSAGTFGEMAGAVKPDGSQVDPFLGPDIKAIASLSPDWSRLTYAYAEPRRWEIFTSAPDGSDKIKLTDTEDHELSPEWSPDGSRIAFYTFPMVEGFYLDTMSTDGSNRHRVAHLNRRTWTIPPLWSPDSRRLAFAQIALDDDENSHYDTWEMYVSEADGSSRHSLGKTVTFPAWSPDSQSVAFLRPAKTGRAIALYTIAADGSNLTKVYQLTNDFAGSHDELEYHLAWSPDSTKILLSFKGIIATVNTDGSDFRLLMNQHNSNNKLRASWSPDGSKIVVGADFHTLGFPNKYRMENDTHVALFTMNPDGSDKRILAIWKRQDGLRIEPGHNQPWPENLKRLEPGATPMPSPTAPPPAPAPTGKPMPDTETVGDD